MTTDQSRELSDTGVLFEGLEIRLYRERPLKMKPPDWSRHARFTTLI
jgi:hypothetical protein